jgi:hypothetical protein
LFGDQDGEGRSNGEAHNSDFDAVDVNDPHVGVITRPSRMELALTAGGQVADDVAVGVEKADFWDADVGQLFLSPGFAQKIFRLEDRVRFVVFVQQYGWWGVGDGTVLDVSLCAAPAGHGPVAVS